MKYDEWPQPWCQQPFGPYLHEVEGSDEESESLAYSCRLTPGHTGPHDCGAAQESGYKDPDLSDINNIEKFLEDHHGQ